MRFKRRHNFLISFVMAFILVFSGVSTDFYRVNAKEGDGTQGQYPQIKLVKTSSTDSNVYVKGAKYGLYTNAACTGDYIESGITDENGVIIFDSQIESGSKFYVKEIEAAPGYHI